MFVARLKLASVLASLTVVGAVKGAAAGSVAGSAVVGPSTIGPAPAGDSVSVDSVSEAEDNNNASSDGEHFPLVASFQSRGFPDPREEINNAKVALKTPFGQLRWPEISKKLMERDGAYWVEQKGYKLKLTIDPELQRGLERQLERESHISAAIVLLESRTGRILAMAERRGSADNPLLSADSAIVAARAPAASLMKIITATAAIERAGANPDDEIPFRGGCQFLRNQNWLRDEGRDRQKLSLALAFGLSCNTVFARLAIYQTGLSTLRAYSERYLYNRPIPSDLEFETSAALMPQLETATALEVGEAGAGFGSSKLSPIHSAMIASAAGNGGVMMVPFLVESAQDSKGAEVYRAQPKEAARPMSASTALKMQELMQETVMRGTSRRYFRRRGTSHDRREIGGKTGTLSDAEDRRTLYTWFNGIAPLQATDNVAIGTLVASPQNWVVRASSVAQGSFAELFRLQRHAKRLATSQNKL